ncbi:hypothetical protein U9M48_034986 [Paspalum notatum var. saurae]|uniref:Uncharacterized protein n=1 Tax=Paspalum notatum var. saurae TaxID=547442 RepID=A0AAQ3X8F2_PASNO
METMPYPCSPLVIPFPTQHEESSYLLWSPQELQEEMIPLENRNMCDADADPSPDHHQQQQDHEFMDMLIQEANGLLLQDELFSNGDPLLAGFDQRLGGPENGSLLAIHEEQLIDESSCGSLSDLLVAGARAVESGDSASASAILSRLDDLIPGVPAYRGCHRRAVAVVSPSDHLACYFARGLLSRLSAGARTECHCPAAAAAAAAAESRTPAYRMMQELSPFIKFAHFTANQAILEATADDPGVHVVDLSVGEGVQWASLMSDLARHGRKPFHLTAAAASEAADAAHPDAARWLSEFADSLGVPFRYSTLRLRSDEDLHAFAASAGGGPVVVSCDTTGKPYTSLTELLAGGSIAKILRPKLVVLAEEELFRLGRRRAPPPPFLEFFREALRHFAAVLDSLASCLRDGGYDGAWLGLVVEEALGPRVEDAVARYETLTGGAAGGAELEGFRACQVSGFNAAQSRMLTGLFSRGFGVLHEEGRLALCWNSRPLTSVSVWSPV